MTPDKEYAFIDESGNTAQNIEAKMLIIAGIVTDDVNYFQRKIKKAEKKLITKKESREIKAFRQSIANRRKILLSLSDANYSVYYVLLKLDSIYNKPYDFKEIYRVSMGVLCQIIYNTHQNISFILDKRYTKSVLRDSLDKSICEYTGQIINDQKQFSISHEDSVEYPGLRAADYVAYEIYQKYRGGETLIDLISSRIQRNLIYQNVLWESIKKGALSPFEKST